MKKQPFPSALQPGLPRHDLLCAPPPSWDGGRQQPPRALQAPYSSLAALGSVQDPENYSALSSPASCRQETALLLSYDDISPCSPRRRLQHSLPFGEFQFQRSKREGRKEGEQKERMNRSEGERERGRKRGEGRREEGQGRVPPVSVHFQSSVILILTSLICHFDFQSNNLEYYTKLSPIPSPLCQIRHLGT